MLRSFHVNLTALSLIALIVGMFLIYNSTTTAVVQPSGAGDPARPGVLRRRLFLLMLSEAWALPPGGPARSLGLLLARLALRLVSPAVSALYVLEHVTHLILTWDTVLIGMGLGIGTALLSAAWPTLTALRLSPLAAMQQRGVYSGAPDTALAQHTGGTGSRAGSLGHVASGGWHGGLGYLACLALVLGVSCLILAGVSGHDLQGRQTLTRWLGVEGLLALDNLVYALRRCTVATSLAHQFCHDDQRRDHDREF